MDHATREMARRCYGYGRWDAPYWFIGPEPGMGLDEGNDLKLRVEAWVHLGSQELCDCQAFHQLIGQKQWHRGKPRLQSTWRPLILLLTAFLGNKTDNESLRDYAIDGADSVEERLVSLSCPGWLRIAIKSPEIANYFARNESMSFAKECSRTNRR